MKQDNELQNRLKQIRTRLGLSQQDLAKVVGVSRQTISGVESGQYAPSATIALRLAKALGCQVEDLFWLEEDCLRVEATPAQAIPLEQDVRFTLARVGGKLMAYPLLGEDAFRTEMIPADGEGWGQTENAPVQVKLWTPPETINQTVAVAGCTPVLSLWARVAEYWYPNLRVYWSFANSMDALERLCRGEVHIAGMHLYSPETDSYNVSFVREAVINQRAVLINLGVWEEGLLLAPGNPKKLRTVADLANSNITIINREIGSGSRQLLEYLLRQAEIPFNAVQGFNSVVNNHVAVARAVVSGNADVGVSTQAVASAFGLSFIPLHKSRYDLVVLKEYLAETPVQQLLNTLGHPRLHSQLTALGGYDTSQTGEVVATIE
ncbi:substrate-binding domain-containing protein [Limnoraphis robusta]|uniref:XRE family transcriptional regulator n=1 Tax=Limnoraphis robusta CS-951 TaxID=1637645 RepID=A0A0F5YGJ9_9CYAN|nr:substrate-binding domain-containing protein [Limnoraphis robusta]KKD37335.1 XRE family transcriptional regulator [Limnoraphis robusta CS-951]